MFVSQILLRINTQPSSSVFLSFATLLYLQNYIVLTSNSRNKKFIIMDGKLGCFARFFLSSKPYIAMICLQFGYAGMNIITKVSLNRGMSHYVLVVYRHAFATAAIAPFAIVLERY